MAGSKNKILGNIPTGSGNDFERTLSQYDDGIHDFDFGIINGRHFINVACVGLDADVANNTTHIENVTHEMTTNLTDTNDDLAYDSEKDESNYLEKGESNLDYSDDY